MDPLDHLIEHAENSVMALITGVEGPSYRPVGAFMALDGNGARVGTLSSGCIEGDLLVHAGKALADGKSRALRYGRGSPFIDIALPCGGGLDIHLFPNPDPDVLGQIKACRDARTPCALDIQLDSGAMQFVDDPSAATSGFRVDFPPAIHFLVFGKGPETTTFAALSIAAGFSADVWSPDEETRALALQAGCKTGELLRPEFPANLSVDQWTAVLAFFHDHEWEPGVLAPALAGPAFYVGAQGSRRSAAARVLELESMGVSAVDLARLRGPIGVIPSARDAQTLSVSVLAEVLDVARHKGRMNWGTSET